MREGREIFPLSFFMEYGIEIIDFGIVERSIVGFRQKVIECRDMACRIR